MRRSVRPAIPAFAILLFVTTRADAQSQYSVIDYTLAADNTALTAHAPNTNVLGTPWTVTGPGAPAIRSNRVYVPSGGSTPIVATIDGGVADGWAQVAFFPGPAGSNVSAGLVF